MEEFIRLNKHTATLYPRYIILKSNKYICPSKDMYENFHNRFILNIQNVATTQISYSYNSILPIMKSTRNQTQQFILFSSIYKQFKRQN